MVTGALDPAPEVAIDERLVRSLLADQHPDLADLPLAELDAGWDNVIYGLGEDLLVRLPRRAVAAHLVLHEQQWLPELAAGLPLPVPTPVRTGVPTADYPWAWSVTPWFEGRSALVEPLADATAAAAVLGAFLVALHRPAPADAPPNPFRGMPLVERDELTQACIADLPGDLPDGIDRTLVREAWAAHVAVPTWDGPALWLHGDLHPHNLVIRNGAVAAVIDFGDLTAGDPATDLFLAWMLLPPEARGAFRSATGVDDLTWQRGRGWALALALAYVTSPRSTPDFVDLGFRTIQAVLADDGPT